MGISGSLSNALIAGKAMSGSPGGSNPQISALEKKLQRLNKEKKEADQNHDADKVKELEKEIQATQQKLEQLKQKDNQKKQQEAEKAEKQKRQEEEASRQQGNANALPDGYGTQADGALLGVYLNRLA